MRWSHAARTAMIQALLGFVVVLGAIFALVSVAPMPSSAGTSTFSAEWDSCVTGESFTLNLNSSRPRFEDAVEALQACYTHDDEARR